MFALCPSFACALEHVTLQRDGKQISIHGRLVTDTQDGGLLVLARDGVLWAVKPEELSGRSTDDVPFGPLTFAELSQVLLAELPQGFEVHATEHYLICYNTAQAYAQWCGSLFERLYLAFTNFWSRRGFDLEQPEFPLVAIVFADQTNYIEYSRPELGDAASSVIGYFSLRTNRMALYDLTGAAGPHARGSSVMQINRLLARPEAARTVATVVHEATHQIAFNCGLHQRYSDCPKWFSEGIAIYFETPDLKNPRGWRSIGVVNRTRLLQFRQYLRKRPRDSLETLLSSDDRFHDTSSALDAYAEAWALTYFLLNQHEAKYLEFLDNLSKKKPLFWDEPATRLEEFRQAFGEDLEKLDRAFVRFMMTRVR
jgi:hypothetical protein